jgi:uncharacterized RDD family membrane protein YckC
MSRAGFGIRLGAAAIDFVVMYLSSSLVSAAAVALLVFSQRNAAQGQPPNRLMFLGMFGITGLIWLAYSLTEVFGAATPAKRLLKLRVGGVDHEPAHPGRRLARWAVKYGPMLVYLAGATAMYVWLMAPGGPQGRPPVFIMGLNVLAAAASLAVLGGFFLTLSSQRRALHDLIAGTVVLRPGAAPQGFVPLMPGSDAPGITTDSAAPPLPETRGSANHG